MLYCVTDSIDIQKTDEGTVWTRFMTADFAKNNGAPAKHDK